MTEVRAQGPVLAIDSCGRETTLALARVAGGRLEQLRERTLAARTAGSLLTRALRELLSESTPAELSAWWSCVVRAALRVCALA